MPRVRYLYVPREGKTLPMARPTAGWRSPIVEAEPSGHLPQIRPEAGRTWPIIEPDPQIRPEAGRGWPFIEPDASSFVRPEAGRGWPFMEPEEGGRIPVMLAPACEPAA